MKRVTAVMAALVSLLVFAVGNATAQGTGTISVNGLEAFTFSQVVVTGSGVCDHQGALALTIHLAELDTNTTGGGAETIQCLSPDEHINWAVLAGLPFYRAGDRVLIDVTAVGAITDADQRETTVKQFH